MGPQLGLGGHFSGVHGSAFIIAGGTNFPDSLPWQGGQKHWYDWIYVLLKNENGTFRWHPQRFQLPGGPRAYGVSVSTPTGVICVGGQNADRAFKDVFRLSWNEQLEQIVIDTLPSLPQAQCMMGGTLIGNTLYTLGGKSDLSSTLLEPLFFSLSLSGAKESTSTWQRFPPLPGKNRILPVVVAQSNGLDACLYAFSGLHTMPGKSNEYLRDVFSYHPKTKTWRKCADLPLLNEQNRGIVAAPAMAFGTAHILTIGGVSGQVNTRLEQLAQQIRDLNATNTPEALNRVAELQQARRAIYRTHPGFPRSILQYHTITDTWQELDQLPFASPVGTTLHQWDTQWLMASGEVYPGQRSPELRSLRSKPRQPGLSVLNMSVLFLYFLALILVGIRFSKSQKNEEDYFKGGGRIPWWAAALSLFGTGLSAITFMAVPAKTFATDWAYFARGFGILFIPFLV
ncbi:MAG: sodium transporter, partial [Bacteroidota bacterium]